MQYLTDTLSPAALLLPSDPDTVREWCESILDTPMGAGVAARINAGNFSDLAFYGIELHEVPTLTYPAELDRDKVFELARIIHLTHDGSADLAELVSACYDHAPWTTDDVMGW
jgi:hypothetical protein